MQWFKVNLSKVRSRGRYVQGQANLGRRVLYLRLVQIVAVSRALDIPVPVCMQSPETPKVDVAWQPSFWLPAISYARSSLVLSSSCSIISVAGLLIGACGLSFSICFSPLL